MRASACVAVVLALAACVVVQADHNCEAEWNYCQHGGVCHDGDTNNPPRFENPSCACPAPYTNDDCGRTQKTCNIDKPCWNGGTCTDNNNACISGGGDCYNCNCRAGYGGKQCRERNACMSAPCVHGTCSTPVSPTLYQCSCPSNSTGHWGGQQCDTWYPTYNCNNPSMTPCQNGGTCNGGGSCNCMTGWTGLTCSDATFCSSSPCANGGTCNTGNQRCQCNIAGGFTGPTCQTPSFCSSSPCLNGATCTNTGNAGAGTCTCDESHYGTFCEKSWTPEGCLVTGCSNVVNFANRCSCNTANAALCAQREFATTCNCPGGWGDCQCNSTATDHCSTLANQCWNGGNCIGHQSGYTCSCPPGFYGSNCENYDNICTSNNKCQNGGQCTLTQVWSSNGYSKPTRGYDYWQCDCQYPFYGEFCEMEADVDNLCYSTNPCGTNGNCTVRTYERGYWLLQPNMNNQRKQLLPYICTCAPGYYGDDCTLTAPATTIGTCATAAADYCQNGGTCQDDTYGPVCRCRCGTAGDRCEVVASDATRLTTGKLLDFCGGEVCYNGGSCYNEPQGQNFVCHCQAGFWGRRCEKTGKSAASGVLPSLFVTLLAVAAAIMVNKQ